MLQQGAANLESLRQGFSAQLQSTLLAIGASGLPTKRGDTSNYLLHSTAKCSHPGQTVAQENVSTA